MRAARRCGLTCTATTRQLGRLSALCNPFRLRAVIHITPHMGARVTVQPMDFRAGIDGLAAACGKRLAADPFSGALFAFGTRARMAINVLVYEGRSF